MTLCPLCPGSSSGHSLIEGGCEKPPQALLHTTGDMVLGPQASGGRGCKAQKWHQQPLNSRVRGAFRRRSGFPRAAVCTDCSQVADLGAQSRRAPGTSFTPRAGGQGWLSRALAGPSGWTPPRASRAFLPAAQGGGAHQRCALDLPSRCLRLTSTHSCLHTSTSQPHMHTATSTPAHTLMSTALHTPDIHTPTHSQASPQTPLSSYSHHTLRAPPFHTFTRTHRFTLSQGRILAHTPTLVPCSHVSTHMYICTHTRGCM